MIFDYPKPLRVGARTWKRVDSFVALQSGNQVMYRQDPVAALANTPYDHISIILDGPELRPKDNELHVTLKAAVPFAGPGQANLMIAGAPYLKINLVFYWDLDLQYKPPSVSLSAKPTFNAGRPPKYVPPGQLVSQAIQGAGSVSSSQDLRSLRDSTRDVRAPLVYAKNFWEDLVKAQPVTLQIGSNDKDDSLRLDYELSGPGFAAPAAGSFDANGCLRVTSAVGALPSQCSVLIKGHSSEPISLQQRDVTYMLFGGRYTCTVN